MNLEGGIQLGDLFGIARRRGKLTIFTALGTVLAAYWLAMALPNLYTSYATVLIEPQAVDQELVRAGVQSSDLNERLHLMTAQILSRPRLSAIIEEHGLYGEESEYLLRENVIDLMRSRITVEPVVPDLEQSRAPTPTRREVEINEFRIFFSDYDSKIASDVAQQLANDFIETHIEARIQVSQKSLEFIQGELERLGERIRSVESEIARVKNENPGSLPEDLNANQRRLERVLGDMAVAQRALAEARSDQGFYESQVATAQFMGSPNDEASPGRRLELLKLQLAEYKSRGFTDKHPDIIATRAEIAAVETSLDMAAGEPRNPLRPSLIQQQAQAQANRASLRLGAAASEIERLGKLADDVQDLIVGTPGVAELLDGLNREYEHLFASFQDFSTRHQEATVQAQLERRQLGEQFRVLESAFAAPDPSAPNRTLIILLGLLLGLALGAGLAIVLEAADTTAHDPRSLQSSFGLPVLAAIPEIWLEADRVLQRRKRLRTAAATVALVAFALVGGAANYLWVNGAPPSLSEAGSGEGEAAESRAAVGTEG
jgi:polysaccharide chain length determinant protein (PEP-CTERM system associated)